MIEQKWGHITNIDITGAIIAHRIEGKSIGDAEAEIVVPGRQSELSTLSYLQCLKYVISPKFSF